MLGSAALAIFFGGFGAWAALASLHSAAMAQGQVRVESHRKTVQHLEGGIIREILVKEGDLVTEGQVLVRLDDTQASSSLDSLRGQRDSLKALESRLLSERDQLPTIQFAMDLGLRRSDPRVAEVLAGQETVFASRRKSLSGQIEVLEQRIAQLDAEIASYQAQLASSESQIRLTEEELTIVRDLARQGLERKPRLLALERQLAQLEGAKGQQEGLIARTQQAIGEAKLQIAGLQNTQAKEVATELRDVQTKLGDLEDRLRAAVDIQNRTQVTAPQSGRVVKMRHFTPGGVVRPGEALLDVVPNEDKLVIDAKISPVDIDTVQAGLDAEVKLTAFKQRRLPILMGKVASVSADALSDERTGQSYYLAEVEMDAAALARLKDVQLQPGMPSEVLVITGRRTPLQYITDPVRDSFRRAFRED